MAFSLALYLAFPFMQITCTPLVLRGVGMRTCRGATEAVLNANPAGQGRREHCSRNTAHLNLLGQQRRFEVGLDDHLHLQFSAANLPDQGNDTERQDDVFSGAVPAARQK